MENENTVNNNPQTGSNSAWIIASLVTLVIILLGYIVFTQFIAPSTVELSPTPSRRPTTTSTPTPTIPVATESATPVVTLKPGSPTITKTITKPPSPTSPAGGLQANPTSTPTPRPLNITN